MNLVIFGAQGYALGVYNAIKSLYPKRMISCFLVSTIGNNPTKLAGLPVRELAEYSKECGENDKSATQVLIATPENIQHEIEEFLENHGFHNHTRLTYDRWSELMKLFHTKLGVFLPVSALPIGCNEPFVRMYVVRSHRDKPISTAAALPEYMLQIQAGTDLTEVRTAPLMDNTGENISHKNGNYSELTVLYWIWKNKLCNEAERIAESGQYYGMSQYRRILDLTADDLLRLYDNDVDVILPYPMPYEPDINAHHDRYLSASDWNALITALKELQPDYADSLSGIMSRKYLYNYNVILAKRKVLREYCEWLFPILDRVEELSKPKGKERSDRYIGYMGESLETLYFIHNADRLNIVHTGCRMYL